MEYGKLSLEEFTSRLASKDAVPGGGGASAVTGALGAALASMVANLTVGKERYAAFEEELGIIIDKAGKLRTRLLGLADKDAEAFLPLAAAYSIPKDAPDRAEQMDAALLAASLPPLDIMSACCEVLELHERLLRCGSRIAMSDVAVGAALTASALRGASHNVFVNAAGLRDREKAAFLTGRAEDMLKEAERAENIIFRAEEMIK